MGLRERRAMQAFESELYPDWQIRITAAAGFPVPIEVDWDSLREEGQEDLYAKNIPKVFFEPLILALEAVGCDALGREALHKGLKRIVIQNLGDYFSPRGFTFTDGILTLDHRPTTNARDVEPRARALQTLLEETL